MIAWLLSFLSGPLLNGLVSAYRERLAAKGAEDVLAVDLAKKEIEAEVAARQEATKILTLENGRWWTWMPRWAVEVGCSVFFVKCVVWDTVLGLGETPALGGDVGNTYMLVMGMWFGSRTIEKVARIFKR